MIEASILDSIGDAIYGLDPDWRITFFNREAERFFDRSRTEVVGRSLWASFPAAVGTKLEDTLRRVMETRDPARVELLSPTTGKWTDARVFPVESGGIAVSWQDITEQKKREIALNEAVENQDLLFRELAHRVTNNFQEVSSRLNLQARVVQDSAARDMLAKMAVSIHCMALVHRRLYRSRQGIEEQDLGDYVAALCRDLKESLLPDNISLTAVAEEGTRAPISVATTVGMMVAELVMNSRKYAWAPGDPGRIVVTMRRDGEMVDLEVRDDGRGMPPGMDLNAAAGLGLKLLQRQIARLKGTFTPMNVEGGASFRLRFPAPGRASRRQEPAGAGAAAPARAASLEFS